MKSIFLIGLFLLLFTHNAYASFTPKEGLTEDSKGWYIWKKFTIGQNISYWAIQMIQPKTALADELPLQDQIQNWLNSAAEKYKINKKLFVALAKCESIFNPDAKGDWRSETEEYMAFGLFQWWKKSWLKYSAVYDYREWNYNSWRDQTELSALVIRDGGIKNWYNCGKWIGWIR